MGRPEEMNLRRSTLASRTKRRSKSLTLSICLSVALCPITIWAHASHSQALRKIPPAPLHVTIEQNGFFYGEEQYYTVTPPIIHVYYQPSAEFQGAAKKTSKRPVRMKGRAESSGDEYFHEIFVLAEGKWTKKYRAVSKKPDGYVTANSCDTTNALDLPGGLLRAVLPHPIKIKEIEDHGDFAVVVYSDTPNQNEYYSLRTALLERDSLSWHVTSSTFSGEAIHFCGTNAFHARLNNGEESVVFLLYLGDTVSDQPDFISIQSFLVRQPKSSFSKQNK